MLLGEGRHPRPYELLGARLHTVNGIEGTRFALWAPNASRVSVVGDFNGCDGHTHPLQLQGSSGFWCALVPGVAAGVKYKFELHDRNGNLLPLKADPYGLAVELRPATASVVAALPARVPEQPARLAANARNATRSLISFVRRSTCGKSTLLVVCNFTPTVHYDVHLGVPVAGRNCERLNSDSRFDGGSDVGTGEVQSQPLASHGHPHSELVKIPPLSCVFFEWVNP